MKRVEITKGGMIQFYSDHLEEVNAYWLEQAREEMTLGEATIVWARTQGIEIVIVDDAANAAGG